MEIFKTLVISTANFHPDFISSIENDNELIAVNTGAGYRIMVCDTDNGNLKEVFKIALDNGCQFIEIDCDGPVIDGLKTFNW